MPVGVIERPADALVRSADPSTDPSVDPAVERPIRHRSVSATAATGVGTEPPSRVRGLDSVRTIATIAVFAYHFDRLRGGWVGLDVFFVLSGYLITSILLRSRRRSGAVTLAGFWGRRARRLLPASLVCIVGTLVLGVALEPAVVGSWARTGAAGAVWMANWQQILSGSSYFDTFLAPNALKHLWSLSVEEQFYVLWPMLVVVISTELGRRRLSERGQALAVAYAAGLLAVVSAAIMWWIAPSPGEDPTRVWFGTDTRAMAPLMGAALAGLVAAYGLPTTERGRRLLDRCGVGAVAVLALIVLAVDDRTQALWHGGMLAVAVVAAVWIASIAQHGRMGEVLSRSRFLVFVGAELTYSLYLWHWPMIVLLTPDRTGVDGWALDGVRLLATTALALVTWAVVERPVRVGGLRRLLVGRPANRVAIAAVAAVAVAGCGVAVSHPTLSDQMNDLAAESAQGPPLVAVAAQGASTGQHVAVFGDSVAWTYAERVTPAVLAAHHTGSLSNYSRWYCQLFDVPRREGTVVRKDASGCPDWRTTWADELRTSAPDVVLLNIGVWEIFDRQFPTGWLTYGTPEFDARLAGALDDVMTLLGSTGARLVVTTAPYPERHPGPEMGAPEWTQERGGRPRIDHFNELLTAAATRHGALVVDFARWVCPTRDGPCRAIRVDGVHFDVNTSPDPILGWILDRVWDDRSNVRS